MRIIRNIIAIGTGLLLAACASVYNKEANPDSRILLAKPVESRVVQKGDAEYPLMNELLKAKVEALPAEKKDPNYEIDGEKVIAYLEKTGVQRFQAGDEQLFTEPFGLENVVKIARADIQQHIEAYNKFIDDVLADNKITPEERDNIVAYVNATVNNLNSIENQDPASQITLRGLLKELNGVLDFYGKNTGKEYFLGVGLVGGQDIGLTGNPQKIEIEEQKIKEILGADAYAKIVGQAKKHGLTAYTPIPPKSDFGDREEELKTAAEQWAEISLIAAEKFAFTDKIGSGRTTRLGKDRWDGLVDGKFENKEILPGATYVQAITTGAATTDKVKEDAKYGGSTVKESYK